MTRVQAARAHDIWRPLRDWLARDIHRSIALTVTHIAKLMTA